MSGKACEVYGKGDIKTTIAEFYGYCNFRTREIEDLMVLLVVLAK